MSRKTRFHFPKLGLVCATLGLLAIVAYFLCANLLTQYLNSYNLRQRIGQKAGQILQVRSGFLPLSWRGLSVYSEGFLGKGDPGRSLAEMRAQHLWAKCNLWQLWHRQMKIERLSVAHLQVAFGPDAAGQLVQELSQAPGLEEPATGNSPLKIDLRELVIDRTDLWWGSSQQSRGSLREVVSRFFPVGKDLAVQGHDGMFRQKGFPDARVESFSLYYARPVLRVETGTLALEEKGQIDVSGRFEFSKPGTMDLTLKFKQCPISSFLAADKRSKVTGTFASHTHIRQQLGGGGVPGAEGSVTSAGAALKNISCLEKIALFTGERRFAPLELPELKGEYRWESSRLTVRNFVAESPGLLRVEGECTMKDGVIEGSFQLGVNPRVLDRFPGAREEVFTKTEKGYCWTPVTLSGSAAKPKNDLMPRLVSAARNHFAKGLLAPLLKPGQGTLEKLQDLF